MNRLIFCSMAVLAFISCSTTEEIAEQGSEPAETAETVEEDPVSPYPEWYADNTRGESSDGMLYGYGKSPGSDAEWALDNAEEQAGANLRGWIDEQLEKAREEITDDIDSASGSDFIRQLRNAVNELDFTNAGVRSEHTEEENSLFAFAKLEASASDLLQDLETALADHAGIWELMVESVSLRSWRNQDTAPAPDRTTGQ
ncbi:MAG: hypothetical protein WEC12_06745 [Balneolaceae bacterium]